MTPYSVPSGAYEPHQPKAISLPAGRGCEFRDDMEKLIEDLQAAITQAF